MKIKEFSLNHIMVLFFIIVFIGGFVLLGFIHEQVHVEIYKSHGIDSHIEYINYLPDLVTVPEKGSSCNDACQLAHNINESIGYQLMPFYILIGMGFLVLIILKKDGSFE